MKRLGLGIWTLILAATGAQAAQDSLWSLSYTQEFSQQLLALPEDSAAIREAVAPIAHRPNNLVDIRAGRIFTHALTETLRKLVNLVPSISRTELENRHSSVQAIASTLKRFSTTHQFPLSKATVDVVFQALRAFGNAPDSPTAHWNAAMYNSIRDLVANAHFAVEPTSEQVLGAIQGLSQDRRAGLLKSISKYTASQEPLIALLEGLTVPVDEYNPRIRDIERGISLTQFSLEEAWSGVDFEKLTPQQRDRLARMLRSPKNASKALTALVVAPRLIERLSPDLEVDLLGKLRADDLAADRVRHVESSGGRVDLQEAQRDVKGALRKSMRQSALRALQEKGLLLDLTSDPNYLVSSDPRVDRLERALNHAAQVAGTDREFAEALRPWQTAGITMSQRQHPDAFRVAADIRKTAFYASYWQLPRTAEVQMQIVRSAVTDPSLVNRADFLKSIAMGSDLKGEALEWLRANINLNDSAIENAGGAPIRERLSQMLVGNASELSQPSAARPIQVDILCGPRFALIQGGKRP